MFSYFFQEPVRHFISHIKTDAVDVVFPDPSLAYITEIADDFFVICIELWHPVRKRKGIEPSVPGILMFAQVRPVLHHKPVRIPGSPSLFLDVQPGGELSPTVVEHCVHHHTDPFFMRLCHQAFHDGVVPERGIDLRIVCSIVLMVRLRLHDGIQIDPRDPKLCEIGELLPDPLQVPAVPLLVCHRACLPRPDIPLFPLRVPAAEAVREDLIPHSVIDPRGRAVHIRRVHPRYDKILKEPPRHIHLFFCEKSVLKIIPHLTVRVEFKIIFASLIRRHKRCRPPYLIREPFLKDDLLPCAAPLFAAAQYSGVKRISVDDEDLFYIVSCLKVHDEPVLIEGIAHLL